MQGKFLFKQLGRSWARSLLWILLLTLVIGFFTVSFGQWYAARRNLEVAAEAFTVIAAVDDTAFYRSTPEAVFDATVPVIFEPGDSREEFLKRRDRSIPDPRQVYLDWAAGRGMIKQIDDRQSSRAFSTNAVAVAHPLEDIGIAVGRYQASVSGGAEERVFFGEHGNAFNYTEFQEGIGDSVLVGRCVDIEVLAPYPEGVSWDNWDEVDIAAPGYGEKSFKGKPTYVAIFEIDHDQSPALHPLYRELRYFRFYTEGTPLVEDYQFPYTVGKDYLLAASHLLSPTAYIPGEMKTTGLRNVTEEPEWYLSYPFAPGAHELECSLPDFLATAEGAKWQSIIDAANRNIRGLTVVGTHNLNAIAAFNKGDARILEGRGFSPGEAAEGAKVCVISAALARENGLAVGDAISLSFQKTGYLRWGYNDFGTPRHFYQPMGFTRSFTDFTGDEEYRVIGLYAAPEWDYHFNSFTPNTVFVPLAAFPAEIPQTPDYQESINIVQERAGMFSFILRPGSEEAFRAALADLGKAEGVHFYDQGYSRIAPQLETLNRHAGLQFLVSILVWLVVMAFFLLLISRGLRPVLGIMLSLGSGRGRLLRFSLAFIIILSLCGMICGGVGGSFAYRAVMAEAYDSIEQTASGFQGSLHMGNEVSREPGEQRLTDQLLEISPGLPLLAILFQGLVVWIAALLFACFTVGAAAAIIRVLSGPVMEILKAE